MKRYLKSGFNTIQDVKLEAGTYTLVLYVKNMYSNVYTFALGDGIDWMEYDVDVIQGKLCKVWVTFTTIRGATKFKPIARNYSLEFPVYVADLQLTRGNVPVEAGASPFDVDQILDDLHDDIDGIEDFTNEAFRDGLLDREEKTQLRASLDAIGSIVESVKGSYDKLLDNPFISNNTMTSITNRYYDFIASWLSDGDPRGLKPVILWIVNGDNIISVEERDEKNRALNAFNVALYKYNQAEKEIYNDIGDNSIAPIIIDGFWAFWNPKKWNIKTNTYGDFEKSNFSAEGDHGHSPYVDVVTKTWWEWNPNLWNSFTNDYGDYWDTGVKAEGFDAKSIEIQSTPTSIVLDGDNSSSPWIFISATTENTHTDIDSWKFFIDDLIVEDTSIAFYNGQEHFWVVKVYDVLDIYPDIKSLGVSVKSTDEVPLTRSIDIPFVREGTDGLNTAIVYLYKRIPEDAIKLWTSTGTFILNEEDPQAGEWTEPEAMIDSSDFDVVFSSKATEPEIPNGHPNQNSDWVNIADETTTWMATSKLENGEWSPWVVSKTKDGDNLTFTVFTRSDTYPGIPEGGTYTNPFPETVGWSNGIPEGEIYPIRDILLYNFNEKRFIEGDMNGWSMNIPDGGAQLYVIGATARSRFDVDEVFPNEWSEMVEMGKNGFNSASITLYQRKKITPLVPQSDCEYTFSTGNLTNFEGEGWLRSVPNGKDKLWVTTATAISTFASDTIKSTEWAYPTIMAEDGQGSLKSTAFIRSNEEPKTPTGGSYINPNPEFDSEIGEEWSDGIPSGNKRLWASTRIFTSDGLKPQQDVWTTPEVMADSAGFDVEFSSEEEPGLPGGPPNDGVEKNPNWSNTADETTIWMATSNFKDGEWSQWTISKIKGEKGEKGDSGTSVSIKGKVADPSKLEELTPGDTRYLGRGYISEDTGDLWLFDGVTQEVYLDKDKIERYATFGWANVGKIQGDGNYIHIAWADNVEFNLESGKFESVDGFTLEDTNKKRWYGLYVDDIKEDALEINAHKYNWVDTKGEAGKDSKSDEYIYIRNNNSGFGIADNTPPSEPNVQDYVPRHLGWTDDPVGVDDSHLYEWVSKRKFRENEDTGEMEWGVFSTPSIWNIFVTDGDDGKDSKSDEYIYRRTPDPDFGKGDNRPPNNPQEDDYVPRELGWTDDPQGVTELEQYEFVSKRIFRNDVWSDFSIPSLWAKWSQDAKNPYAAYDKTIGGQYNDGKKYWFVWDVSEKKYINSGDPSQGDDGNQPRINSEGFWEVWGDTGGGILGYVPTTIKARGEDGVSSFKSVVFKRYIPTTDKPTPDTPRAIDGSYAEPVPTGWSDGIPNGDGVLWASTRVFAENGATPPQQDVWTTPEVMADSAGFDVEFSSIETNPGDPTKNPEYWSNTADETTIWMATSNLENGIWSKWSIAKIKGEKGKDGNSAPLLVIAESAHVMICNYNNVAEAGQTISIEAKIQNVTDTAKFVATPYNDVGTALTAITLGGSGNTRTLTNAQWLTTYKKVVITVTLDSYSLSDVTTIHRLSRPKDGDNGKDALVGFLTNENITLQASSTGVVTLPSIAVGYFRLYSGITLVTSDRTFARVSQTGCEVTIDSTGYYSVGKMSADNATATFSVKYGTTTIEKTLTLSKSKAGKDNYFVSLSKENHTYTYDKNNNLKGYLSDGATTISVQRGDIFFECDTTSIGYAPVTNNTYRVVAISVDGVSYSRALVNGELKIWPSAFTSETGSLTFTIRAMSDGVESKDFKKTISFSKNKDGADGKAGTDGLPGIPGQIPIQKEWVEGDTHRNTDEIVDYIYVRGVNKEQSYWYKRSAKGTTTAGAPPENGATRTGYLRIDWLKELAVNVLLAEEANVAGFIFKDEKLISMRGETFAGLEILYGEYTEYEFTNRTTQPSVGSSYWTSLPEGTTTFIRFKKNTENNWTVKAIGTYDDRWTVQYADRPDASSWDNSFATGRVWMQIKEAGEQDFRDAVKIDVSDGHDFIPKTYLDGVNGDVKITGTVNAERGLVGGFDIEGEKLTTTGAGLSGVVGYGRHPAIWGGGSYEDARKFIQLLEAIKYNTQPPTGVANFVVNHSGATKMGVLISEESGKVNFADINTAKSFGSIDNAPIPKYTDLLSNTHAEDKKENVARTFKYYQTSDILPNSVYAFRANGAIEFRGTATFSGLIPYRGSAQVELILRKDGVFYTSLYIDLFRGDIRLPDAPSLSFNNTTVINERITDVPVGRYSVEFKATYNQVYSTTKLELSKTDLEWVYAPYAIKRTQIGNNGFMAWFGSDKHFYVSDTEGVKIKGFEVEQRGAVVVGLGRVSSGASISSNYNSPDFNLLVSKNGLGKYKFAHNLNTDIYSCQVTATQVARSASIILQDRNYTEIETRNEMGNLTDSSFSYTFTKIYT